MGLEIGFLIGAKDFNLYISLRSSMDIIISQNMEDCHAEFLSSLDGGEYWCTFTQIYYAHSLPSDDEKSNLLQTGNRIIMPPSSLDRLMNMQIAYPIMLQIYNVCNMGFSHCGVEEFTGEEGSVLLPKSVMDNLGLVEGGAVMIKNVDLPKGTFMKLQPHSKDFLDIYDHKHVLETQLKKFSCVTCGDTIMINHNERNFYINVLETKPSNAISLIDTDCEVDFEAPLDYVEPARNSISKKVEEKKEVKEEEEPMKGAFAGASRRLNENNKLL